MKILATSREPLRVEGERIHHLGCLSFPESPLSFVADLETLILAAWAAIERATASQTADFKLEDGDVDIVGDICRDVEGIPLAIEFCCGLSSEHSGLRGLALRLEDRLRLLSLRRHAVLDRHQTLRATHDWSYGLLDEREQTILRRVSIFAGHFTMASAIEVSTADGISESEIIDYIGNLVSKSLISADISGGMARYRLLDTTRAYALEKLRGVAACANFCKPARAHSQSFRPICSIAHASHKAEFLAGRRISHWASDQIGNVRGRVTMEFFG